MEEIRFDKAALVEVLLSILFFAAGIIGLIYDAYCGVIVFDRYYAVCFGTSVCCLAMSLFCLILELLFND